MFNKVVFLWYTHEMSNLLLTWRSPLYLKFQKTWKWFAVAGVFTVLMVIYGLLSGSQTFSVAILVAAAVYYFVHDEDPATIDVQIFDDGVKVG